MNPANLEIGGDITMEVVALLEDRAVSGIKVDQEQAAKGDHFSEEDNDNGGTKATEGTEVNESPLTKNNTVSTDAQFKILFQCEYCKKLFRQADELQVHKTKCSSYRCEHCPEVFANFKQLRKHRNIYTMDKQYQLGYCKRWLEDATHKNCATEASAPMDDASPSDSESDFEILPGDFADSVQEDCHGSNESVPLDIPSGAGTGTKLDESANSSAMPREEPCEALTETKPEEPANPLNQCDICKKYFVTKYVLKTHRRIHTGVKPHKCKDCGKSFLQRSHLKSHSAIHSGARPFPCSFCEKAFRYSSDRNRHEARHRLQEEMKNRDRTLQPADQASDEAKHPKDKRFPCEHCDKVFLQNGERQAHIRSQHFNQLRYRCSYCEKWFKTNSGFQYHERIHRGEYPFQCDTCGKKFRQRPGLLRHEKVHQKGAPFNCYVCGEGFQRITDFTEHKKGHIVPRPYQCDVCGVTFRLNTHLHNHRGIHTGKKPYPCDVCGKAFRVSSTLKKHKLIHEREKAKEKMTLESEEVMAERTLVS